MFQIIFQFAFSFLQQTCLQKIVIYQYKRIINDEKSEVFLQNLRQYDWDTIKTHQDKKEAYNNFILIFCNIHDTFFL